ncbi:hypothetical protein J6O48_09505 [bacterium]|jgi:hypothetical protein|nr:hypothetical protein [bacterium]
MGIEKLEKEMEELSKEITKNKVAIADLFLEIHRMNIPTKPTFDDFVKHIDELSKMPKLIEELDKNEARYNAMLDSKLLIESSETEVYVKQ